MITNMEKVFEDYGIDLELDSVINDMELIWAEAKLKALENKTGKDFTEQEKRLKILRNFREKWLQTREDNRVLNELVFKVTKNFHEMNAKIISLQTENNELKSNITL